MRMLRKSELQGLAIKARDWLKKLSTREKIFLLITVVLFVLKIGWDNIYEPASAAFAAQNQKLIDVEADAKRLVTKLERYAKLRARRDFIENQYSKVEIREGALSHLEELVKNKAGITSFNIKDTPSREFAGIYEQTMYVIKFQIASVEKLVEFLKEIVHGVRPLVLGRIDIQKNRRGDMLQVEIDVSSIKRVKAAE